MKVCDDLFENGRVEAVNVHLVDGENDMSDAQQGRNERVATCLTEDALAAVDEDNGQVGV